MSTTQGFTKRRAHPRFAVDMDAHVLVDGQSLSARTRDLSRGGICFILPVSMKVGSNFTVQLSLVFGENAFSEPLVLVGKIIWSTKVEDGFQIGAAFVSLDDEVRQYLNMFLNFLENGLDGAEAFESAGVEGADDADILARGPDWVE
ncbi:MAG: PilZ domain-containing protein [Deltaproteobacteria bacterium]|nr:PilZ domain-containing protein [Deltaproteobacteria bacterium]